MLVVLNHCQNREALTSPTPAYSPQSPTADSSLKKEAAKKGLDEALFRIQTLLVTQRVNLLPSIDDYPRDPSPARWLAIRQDVAETTDLIRNAMRAVIDYDARLADGLGPQLKSISGVLRTRGVMVNEVSLSTSPMTPDELKPWQAKYHELIGQLTEELKTLRTRLN